MATKAKVSNGATETIETMVKSSSDAMKQSFDRATKSYDSLASFNKETVDALMQSASLTSKGMEAINAEALAFSKQAIEDSVAAAKAAMTSKSIQELMEIQSDFAKSSFESFVGQATKMGEMFTSLAKETAEPINGRTAAFMEIIQSSRVA